MDVLTGTDFFTVEVLSRKRLMTYYVLFFIQLETRRVCLARITPYPDQQWMEQQARNVTIKDWGFLAHSRYLLHDRDGKFCSGFREVIKESSTTTGNATTKAKPTNFYSPYHEDHDDLLGGGPKEQSGAGNDWAAYSSTTSVEHRDYWGRTDILTLYFDPTRFKIRVQRCTGAHWRSSFTRLKQAETARGCSSFGIRHGSHRIFGRDSVTN